MTNELGNANPETGENEAIVLEEEDDLTAVTDKFNALTESHEKATSANRQLFERAKKAEGFTLKEGEWVKSEVKPKAEPKEEPKVETTPSKESSESNELDYGQLAFHNSKADSIKIESTEDREFLQKTMEETGKSQEALLDAKWFQSELKERASATKSTKAIPKGKGRTGTPSTDDLDVAMAKYNETGDLPEDFETRNKVVDKIVAKEKSKMFEGKSVI